MLSPVNSVRLQPAEREQSRTEKKEEIPMNKHVLRNCIILALGLATTQAIASATFRADDEQQAPRLEGVWNVSVTINNCDNGQFIRNVRALHLFIHDGSMTETGANILRGPGVGTWRHLQDNTYTSTFRFFRYHSDGTFASTAKVTRMIELSQDGTQFTSTGTVEDFDAQNVRISVTCPTETAALAQ
jgi:hypothetical protein